jgi:RHS repeat-associated protein
MDNIVGNVTMTPTYNSIGQVTTLGTNCITVNNGSCVAGNVVTSAIYNALGESTADTLGINTGVGETWNYNDTGHPTSYSVSGFYNYSVSWAPPPFITSSTDSENGNWSYTYDAYNRLNCAWQGSACSSAGTLALSWTYDEYGNRWQQNLLAGTGYHDIYSFNVSNHNTTAGFTYDIAGNLVNDTFHTYSYDAEGRLLSVDSGTETYNYNSRGLRNRFYIGSGPRTPYERLFTTTGLPEAVVDVGTNTFFLSEFYEDQRHLATLQPWGSTDTTIYLLSDWLGTIRKWVDESGNVDLACTSLPFGELSGTGCEGNNGWSGITGLWLDGEDNTVNTPARQYAIAQGRWTSPDPAGMAAVDITNPQSWNRYAYVNNNPLNASDPSGLDDAGSDDGDGGFYGGSSPGFINPSNPTSFQLWQFSATVGGGFGSNGVAGERAYESWVNAVWQAGGSTITWGNGVTDFLNWTIEGGVYGVNGANGETIDVADAIEEAVGAIVNPGTIASHGCQAPFNCTGTPTINLILRTTQSGRIQKGGGCAAAVTETVVGALSTAGAAVAVYYLAPQLGVEEMLSEGVEGFMDAGHVVTGLLQPLAAPLLLLGNGAMQVASECFGQEVGR